MHNLRPTWIDVTRSSSLLKCCILIESRSDSARISSPARCTKSGSSWVKSIPSKSSSLSATDEVFATEWFLAWTFDACKRVCDLSSAESVAYIKCITKLPISPNRKQKQAYVLVIFSCGQQLVYNNTHWQMTENRLCINNSICQWSHKARGYWHW